ncbi:MAG: serine hydrolase domain-containing protein [Verrucomicrobiia bacterium]
MKHNRIGRAVIFVIALLNVCVLASLLVAATLPDLQSFKSEKLKEIELAISNSIQSHNLPGAVICIGHKESFYLKAFGNRSIAPETSLMTEDTIFDAASLTKVIATAPSVMLLYERGKIASLDDPVRKYIPEFDSDGREKITIKHLLTHTSGLRAGISPNPPWVGYEIGIKLACAEKPRTPPGSNFLYSDVNFILLGEVVRRVSGKPLNEFAEKEIFLPLKMLDTGFLPRKDKLARVAPTQYVGKEMLRGVVHDPVARNMGGVAGHAGVFTTASDLARFCRMFLNEGELDGAKIFNPETVRLMRSVQTPNLDIKRGLGWDIDSGYSKPRGKLFPVGSYGHTGFTGTALWIDPYSKTFWIFLSNRVHPDGKGNVLALQTMLGTLVAESLADVDFSSLNKKEITK